jgi:sugar (pentulose or hexulose) kinase
MAEKNNMTKKEQWSPEKSEQAMVEGILEGSPDGIGVAVIRLDCGCRKMAAIDKEGEPASKVIMYRDRSESICDKCKEDDGSYQRVTTQFIYCVSPEPDAKTKEMIQEKVLGIKTH